MDKNELHLAETIVIGAEPGGYVTAIGAGQLGQKVTICWKRKPWRRLWVKASDIIAELSLAMEAGLIAEDLLNQPCPANLGEIVMESAEVALESPIHIVKWNVN